MSNAPPKQFFAVFSENTAFFKKIVEEKNIQHQIFDKKGYIRFWCKMIPDRSHSDTVGRGTNKVRVEGDEAPFNPYIYGSKYRSSDAIPAPEIFFPNSSRFYLFFNFF